MQTSPQNDTQVSSNSSPLKRAMSTRHLVMISLGGAIGTGLFLGSGEVISQTGPIGAIISYILGGIIAYMVMLCLGELAVHMPESGSFGSYAQEYIGPATGYTVTWLYWLTWSATLGTEFTAAALLMQEWFPHVSMWLWTLIFAAIVFGLNMSSTKWFAESEFWLALVKVITVIAFIIFGLLDIFGIINYQGYESAPLFSNLANQDWSSSALFSIFATMLIVNFAFSGTELIGVAAGETQDPAKNVPKAINTAIWRLLIFFVGTIVVISALLPHELTGLGTHGVSSSPFVTVFDHIGIPYIAVIVTMFGALPGLLSEHFAPETIFKNLLGVAAFTMVVVWMSICLSQFNFRRRWYKQGHSKAELGFAAPLFPIVPILGFICCLITGISMVFDPEMVVGFICCMVFIAACYLSYALLYKNKPQ